MLPSAKFLTAAAIILLGAVASHILTPTEPALTLKDKVSLDNILPHEFAGWVMDEQVNAVQPLQQSTLSDAIYDQTITRGYHNSAGDFVMLLVAYGANQSDALQLHRPDVCYVANGFRIISTSQKDIVLESPHRLHIPASRMMAVSGNRFEPVTFWTRVGNDVPVKALDRQWEKLKYGLSGRIPDGLLVRVSSLSSNPEMAYNIHDAFIRDLLQAIPEEQLPIFLGQSD